ncbi:MAG: BatD family protein, partial [Kiritimatiellales bacterium]
WQEAQGGRDVINNVIYDIRRFQTRTRAVSSGTFSFSPVVTAQVAVPNQRSQRRDPFFNSFFDRVETRPVELPVEKAVLTVKPLPEEGKPAGFSGAVGRFTFGVSARPTAVHPGDPVTLTMTISGNGNFDRVMIPPLPTNESFRLFGEPVRKQAENEVQFEQVISPRTADVKEIPAIPFSFFDTQSGQYRTISSKPIPLAVTASSNSTAQVFAAKDSIVMPPPETPFATESDVQRMESALQSIWQKIRPWLWTVPTALFIGFAGFFGQKLHLHRRNDTARVRRQKAPKAARNALRAAEYARRKSDRAAFYDALWNALADYFGHRLNLPPGDVTSSTVLLTLSRASLDPEQINALRAIFEQVEASRYGLQTEKSPENMGKLLTTVEQILKRCEKATF